MRDGQPRLVDLLLAEEQQVEVDRPRAPARAAAAAAQLAFDGEQLVEQAAGAQRRAQPRRGVQKARLVEQPDRIGLADPGDRLDLDPGPRRERGDRGVDGRPAVAEVGA